MIRQIFVCENPGSKLKLAELKQSIRASKFPVLDYTDPKALGELVLKDLTEVIDRLYPEGSQPDPLDREAMDHEAFAQSRERVYIGRPEYFERLDAHGDGSDDQPLVVLGESGSGKSALLANWVARYREKHPDLLIVQHYIGATPYSADWAQMVRRIMGELKRRFGIQQEIPDKPEELRSAFPNWLYMAAAKGRMVLVFDALNQLEDRDGAPDLVWLPPVLPGNVRLIVSTLPGRPLEEIKKRNWPTMTVELLTDDERKQLIKRFLFQHAKRLRDDQIVNIAKRKQTANPLYLRVLLDELRQFGEYDRLAERIDYYLKATSIYELYEKVIARWESDFEGDSDLVGDALSLFWAARRGLAETELLQLLGTADESLPRATWSPLYLAMSDALVSRGGLLTFAHDFLRTATRGAYLQNDVDQQQAHLRLADYFESQPAGHRRTDEFPWQLAEGSGWQQLYDLLCDDSFFKGLWQQNRFDAQGYWAQIEGSSRLRMVEAYRMPISHPEKEPDKDFLWTLGLLLENTGHPEEALSLRSELVEHFRATGNLDGLRASLGNQALILQARGDLDGAMALHKEKERICRELGNKDSLQHQPWQPGADPS